MIRFTCLQCGRHISVDDKHSGKKGKCPKCGNVVVVPDRSTIIEFRCDSCGQKIKVPERHAGKRGKCPRCTNTVVVPSLREEPVEEGRIAPGFEAPIPPGIDEDLYEASPEATEESVSSNRRLMLLISGVAAIVLVGCIVLAVVVRSSGSGPAGGLQEERAIADAAPSPHLATSGAPPAEGTSPTDTPETIRLRFCPAPGPARTVEVTTWLAVSSREDGQEQDMNMTTTETCAFSLEVNESYADGMIPIRIAVASIRIKSEAQGRTMGEYDSTGPQADDNGIAAFYAPYIGKGFTIRVSPRGQIVDFGLDELFLVVAENPLFGRDKIRGLLGHLVASLPEQPVRGGESWSGPVVVEVGMPVGMAATYTLEAVDDDACTITAEGHRALEEEPFVYEVGQTTVSNELGGSSEVTLTADRRTGWLLNKEQTTHLSGQITMSTPGVQRPDTPMQVSLEITTTVDTVK